MIDIRLPIGGLFTVFGLMLLGFGAASDPARYQQSLGINVNLDWGIVMLAFGLIMLALGKRGNRSSGAPGSNSGPSAEN